MFDHIFFAAKDKKTNLYYNTVTGTFDLSSEDASLLPLETIKHLKETGYDIEYFFHENT